MNIRDISHYDFDNGATVDFSQYDGFMIKATEGGDYVDPHFEQSVAMAKAAGKPYGFYHYFSFVTDVAAQISNFISHTAPYQANYRPSLDVEQDKRNNTDYPINHKERVLQALTGIPNVMLYTNLDGLNHLDTSHGAYPLWLAEYGVAQPKDVVGFSRVGWQYQESPDLNDFTDAIYTVNPVNIVATVAPTVAPAGDPAVKTVQQKLNRLHIGAPLVTDGVRGPITINAVKLFQSAVGITVDGVYGSQSDGAYQAIVSKPTLKQGSTGIAVRYIQYRLGAGIDGQFGAKTAAAVKAFQSQNGLSSDGIIGPASWGKLIG